MSRRLHQPRRRSARSCGMARWAVGIFLMFAAVLAPVDATRLPGPADDLVGTPPAQALTQGVVDGTPGDCEAVYGDGWKALNEDLSDPDTTPDPDDVGSLCVLETSACPDPLVVKLRYRPQGNESGIHKLTDGTDRTSLTFDSVTFERSTVYSAFCVGTAYQSDTTTTAYADCHVLDDTVVIQSSGRSTQLRAWVFVDYPSGNECRMTVPARCPSADSSNPSGQLNRIGTGDPGQKACRAIQRRTWSCTNLGGSGNDGDHMNQFGKCYVERDSPSPSDPHAACDGNPPPVPFVSCRDYVGGNYIDSPGSQPCGGFTYLIHGATESFDDFADHAHWCRYNSSHLDSGCQDDSTMCRAGSDAFCIKRDISGTGCDGIAATLRCRDLQTHYRPFQQRSNAADEAAELAEAAADIDRSLKPQADAAKAEAARAAAAAAVEADAVFAAGCVPCVPLPFNRAPSACPPEITASSITPPAIRSVVDNNYNDAHRHEADWVNRGNSRLCGLHHPGESGPPRYCDYSLRCVDPPGGQLSWESNTRSGIALAGSRVTLRVEDLPTQSHRRARVGYGGSTLSLTTDAQPNMLYPDGTIVHTYLQGRGNEPPVTQGVYDVTVLVPDGVCVVMEHPRLRVRIEEMWFDEDYHDIHRLIGPDAVAWWNDPGTDRDAASQAQGFMYIGPSTSAADADTERQRRTDVFGDVVHCRIATDDDPDVWCPWVPKRAGYYRLTAVGAWRMQSYWHSSDPVPVWRSGLPSGLSERLRPPAPPPPPPPPPIDGTVEKGDNVCDENQGAAARVRDYDCFFTHLGFSLPPTPGEVADFEAMTGIDVDAMNREFSGMLPLGTDDAVLQERPSDWNVCPPLDLRLRCSGYTAPAYNYTESAPIGIAVYEVRTVSRPPGG